MRSSMRVNCDSKRLTKRSKKSCRVLGPATSASGPDFASAIDLRHVVLGCRRSAGPYTRRSRDLRCIAAIAVQLDPHPEVAPGRLRTALLTRCTKTMKSPCVGLTGSSPSNGGHMALGRNRLPHGSRCAGEQRRWNRCSIHRADDMRIPRECWIHHVREAIRGGHGQSSAPQRGGMMASRNIRCQTVCRGAAVEDRRPCRIGWCPRRRRCSAKAEARAALAATSLEHWPFKGRPPP